MGVPPTPVSKLKRDQSRSEDFPCLVFWLCNTTVWLHLMRCDNSINEACELLGSFVLVEEVINSVFGTYPELHKPLCPLPVRAPAVFVLRYVERRIDQLLNAAILDHSPLPSGFDGIQFESEWSLLRSLTPKRKPIPGPSVPQLVKNGIPTSPSPSRSTSPVPTSSPPSHHSFASLKQSFSRSRGTPMQSMFQDTPSRPNPSDVISVFDALQTFLVLSGTNPALITQIWSQVFYWIACKVFSIVFSCFVEDSCIGEVFNRVLTRKNYLCRCATINYFSVILADVTQISCCSNWNEPERIRGVGRNGKSSPQCLVPPDSRARTAELAAG